MHILSKSDGKRTPQESHQPQQQRRKFEGPKREAILDLAKYKDTKVRVKLMGGRLVTGVLKGYDQLMNLVLDETLEYMRDPEDSSVILKDKTRSLGLIVIRGTVLLSLSPCEGSEVIYVQEIFFKIFTSQLQRWVPKYFSNGLATTPMAGIEMLVAVWLIRYR